MNFNIVFKDSGDTIPVEATNSDFTQWFIETNKANQANELFGQGFEQHEKRHSKFVKDMETLQSNAIVKTFCGFSLDTKELVEYFDQKYSAKLHADWVNSLQNNIIDLDSLRNTISKANLMLLDLYDDDTKTVGFDEVIDRIGLRTEYMDINHYVHGVEQAFNQYELKSRQTTWFDNPFATSIVDFSRPNVGLKPGVLGRTAYDKFRNLDMELEADDLSLIEHIPNIVYISFKSHCFNQPAPEYLDFCKKHNLHPVGDSISLGSIPNLFENVEKYRTILYRNWQAGNPASLEL